MTEPKVVRAAINNRFNKLLIGLAEAQISAGVEDTAKVQLASAEQSNARRELLRVEKLAIRDKELNKKSEQNYIDSIRDMVEAAVLVRLKERLANEDELFNKILGFDRKLPTLLDALSARASSISKLEPLASDVHGLYDDLIKMVNMPKYRRTDAKGKVMTVDTLRVALSFVGIDNLKFVVPSLMFRRWIPQITDPYPEIKSRIWEAALGTALASKKIAEVSKVDAAQAFTLGLFHDLGRIIVTRLYFRVFDEVQRDAQIEAHNERKREEHAALSQITPSANFLASIIEELAPPISRCMIEKMNFKRVFIAPAMKEITDNMPISHMSPLAKVVTQGSAYNKYRMLKAYKLMNIDEAKAYLRQFYFPNGALGVLKNTDLRNLDLKMDEE